MAHVFTYGSLMFDQVFKRVVRGRYDSVQGCVRHFKRTCIRNHSYPVVVPVYSPTPLVGTVYLNVSTEDVHRLDVFEGQYYQRQRVQVSLEAHKPKSIAQIYVLKPAYRHLASSRPWSPQRFEQDQLEAFLNEYLS